MKVLVACEESQAVTKEFRKRGHEAYSCDMLDCSGGHPEWHIRGDVTEVLSLSWDMIIAFPPCTYLTNAGARHLWKGHVLNKDRYEKGLQGKEFFMLFYHHPCHHVVIENPTPSKVFELPPPSQVIQPYQFGHPYTKRTQLWIKGLPLLQPTNVVEPTQTWCPSGSYSGKHSDRHKGVFTTDRARNRSKTFPGVAAAMADQWGGLLPLAFMGKELAK